MITPIDKLLSLSQKDLSMVEFFRPDIRNKMQVNDLCTKDTAKSLALKGAVIREVTICPPSSLNVSRRIIPCHKTDTDKIYFIVRGQAEVVVEKENGQGYESFRLLNNTPVVVPANRTHAMIFTGPASFIVILMSKGSTATWQDGVDGLLLNGHLQSRD